MTIKYVVSEITMYNENKDNEFIDEIVDNTHAVSNTVIL